MKPSTLLRMTVLLLSAVLCSGCGAPTEENLSARGTSDPAKLERAQAEAGAATAKAKAAKAAKTNGAINVEER